MRRGLSPAASITISNRRKQSSSSCSGVTTRTWTASPSAPLASWTIPGPFRSAFDRIVDLRSRRLRSARWTHGAALQMTFYEGPTSRTRDSAALAQQRPTGAILRRCCRPCALRDGAATYAPMSTYPSSPTGSCRRCCRWDLTSSGTLRAPDKVATLLCRILLEGLGRWLPPTDAERTSIVSAAFIAADDAGEVVDNDDRARLQPMDKAAHVRAVARAEFSRKGYEVTSNPRHRVGRPTRYRDGVSLDRLEGRTARVDHAVVRTEGRRGWTDVVRTDAARWRSWTR